MKFNKIMEKIKISTEYIKLSQFLKLANMVESGGKAKFIIDGGKVKVNNKVELKRGKKILKGDIIEFGGKIIQVD